MWVPSKRFFATFVRFGLVGGFATVLHYGLYYLLHFLMGANAAFTLGYVISFVANFYLTSYFTFGTSPSWRRLWGMCGAHVVNYLLQVGLLNLFLWLKVPEVLAPLPVYVIAVPVNFILVRFVFTRNGK